VLADTRGASPILATTFPRRPGRRGIVVPQRTGTGVGARVPEPRRIDRNAVSAGLADVAPSARHAAILADARALGRALAFAVGRGFAVAPHAVLRGPSARFRLGLGPACLFDAGSTVIAGAAWGAHFLSPL
jgi:hypothetical protein